METVNGSWTTVATHVQTPPNGGVGGGAVENQGRSSSNNQYHERQGKHNVKLTVYGGVVGGMDKTKTMVNSIKHKIKTINRPMQ